MENDGFHPETYDDRCSRWTPIAVDIHFPRKQREAPSGLTKEQTRKTLKNSILDGGAASVMSGLTGNYVTPYALTMQASTQQIGYLSSIPSFANMLVLLVAPFLSERAGSRKSLVLPAVLAQALMWLPILAIPYLFNSNQVWWLIAFVTLSTVAGSLSGPPWSAMMADLIPMELRGRYLGVRNRINGFVALVFSFVAGGLLQLLTGNVTLAFAIICGGAFAARLSSFYFLSLMNEPHPSVARPTAREGIPQIARGLLSTAVGRFMVFTVFLNMAVNTGSPFFSAYVLRELKYSYISYQFINAASAVVTLLAVTWWGRRADRAGSVKILRITAVLIPFVPVMWLVSNSVYWMSFVQVYSGFVWAGFNICAGLFIYDASPQENRARYIALYGALASIGTTLGSLAGGNLGPLLPRIAGSYFLTLFLVSGISRMVVVLLLLRLVSEVRDVQPVSTADILFSGLRPAALAADVKSARRRLENIFRR